QSVVHSLVEYIDGSVLAQLGHPDMRTLIAHALASPHRVDTGVPVLDLVARSRLEFEPLDEARFPCVRLAYDALRAGDYACVTLNATNEIAVDAFPWGHITFTAIARAVKAVLDAATPVTVRSLEDAFDCDRRARRATADTLGLRADDTHA